MGAQTERHDFQPFGWEPANTGWRTQAGGYGVVNPVRQQFTGAERDAESSIDYMMARYYIPAQGRFASVDPDNAGANLADPQSWNGYSYVGGMGTRMGTQMRPVHGEVWERQQNPTRAVRKD
jgi:RHS repeat-associated protein